MDDVTTETTHLPHSDIAGLAAELAETTAALVTARRELETLRVTHYQLLRTHEAVRASSAFRIANRLSTLGNAVRRR